MDLISGNIIVYSFFQIVLLLHFWVLNVSQYFRYDLNAKILCDVTVTTLYVYVYICHLLCGTKICI